jgi:hypothetical protein
MVATDPPSAGSDEAPYIAGIWVVICIIVLLWLRARSPDRVRRFGQALDEGETV